MPGSAGSTGSVAISGNPASCAANGAGPASLDSALCGPQGGSRRSRRWFLGRAVWYGLLAIAATWPLMGEIHRAIPQATQAPATVPLFNLWTVWWNADRLRHALSGYWDAPIFYPTRGAFAFSESQATLWLVAPFAWWGSPPLAYNVYLLGSLVLNGWLADRLLRRLGHPSGMAVVGGGAVAMLPFVHGQLGVLQLVPLWGILWTWLALDRFAEQPVWCRGLELGVAFGATYLACHYYGLFLGVLLAIGGPVLLGRRLFTWRVWLWGLLSVATAALLTGPVVWMQLDRLLEHRFAREAPVVRALSTTWQDYVYPSGLNQLQTNWPLELPLRRRDLSPGHLKTLLAVVGIVCGLFIRERRRRTCYWGLMLLASLLLASSPQVSVGDWNLHADLVRHWPGFAQIRSIYRFAVFAQLAVVVLSTEALRALSQIGAGRWRFVGPALALLLGVVCVFEVRPMATQLYYVPIVHDAAHWTEWLRRQTPFTAVVTHAPQAENGSEAAHAVTATAMYYQTFHRRALAEGYSGFFPRGYRQLRTAMQTFPDGPSLDLLRSTGVQYCVVDRRALPSERLSRLTEWAGELRPVYDDRLRDVVILEILPANRRRQTATTPPARSEPNRGR